MCLSWQYQSTSHLMDLDSPSSTARTQHAPEKWGSRSTHKKNFLSKSGCTKARLIVTIVHGPIRGAPGGGHGAILLHIVRLCGVLRSPGCRQLRPTVSEDVVGAVVVSVRQGGVVSVVIFIVLRFGRQRGRFPGFRLHRRFSPRLFLAGGEERVESDAREVNQAGD